MGKKKDLEISFVAGSPNPDFVFSAYSVDFPEEWRQAIIALEKPNVQKYPDINLQTNDLKNLLSADIPEIARINMLKANPASGYYEQTRFSWMISTKPIDTKKVCRIISLWMMTRYGKEYTDEIKSKFTPDKLESTHKNLTFKILDGRDKEEYKGIPFCVIPQYIADSLTSDVIVINNTPLRFFMNNDNATHDEKEIVSQPMCENDTGDWYSIVIEIKLETRPPFAEYLICVNTSTRRYISRRIEKKETDGKRFDFFHKDTINAMIITKGSRYIVPIKRVFKESIADLDGNEKKIFESKWDKNAADCFNLHYTFGLPAIEEVIEHPEEYVKEDARVRIMMPYKYGIGGTESAIGTGVSAYDKENVFSAVKDKCSDMVVPLSKDEITHKNFCNINNLKSVLKTTKAKLKAKVKNNEITEEERITEIRRIRTEYILKRFALCWGRPRVVFEIYGTAADKNLKQRITATIRKYLGTGNANLAVDIIEMDEVDTGNIIARLEKNNKINYENRVREISNIIPDVNDIRMAFVILQNYPEIHHSNQNDPKKAIRAGLARVHRLTQFITPDSDKKTIKKSNKEVVASTENKNEDKVEGKVDGAVLDALRQLGYTDYAGSKDFIAKMENMTVIGLCLLKGVQYQYTAKAEKYAKKDIPIIISYNMKTGKISVRCSLWSRLSLGEGFLDCEELSYPEALLKMSEISWAGDFESCDKGDIMHDFMDYLAECDYKNNPILVTTCSNEGDLRLAWRGLQVGAIAKYTYPNEMYIPEKIIINGERKNEKWVSFTNTGLRIITCRTRETPDWYILSYKTDSEVKEIAETPIFSRANGIYKNKDVYYCIEGLKNCGPSGEILNALTHQKEKINDVWVDNPKNKSRISHPKDSFDMINSIEVFPIQLQPGDNADDWVDFFNALRTVVPENQSHDMTCMPLPLHYAKKMTEYLNIKE